MSMGRVRAMVVLHRAFHRYPLGHRIHVFVRAVTAPFTRTLDAIPSGSRVLEIGAGHGAYSELMAANGAREVVAVEPDLRKSLLPAFSPKVTKVAGYDTCVRGTFDAVVLYDVFYLFAGAERRALLERTFARLKHGGLLVLKDMDPERTRKTAWARTQERLSRTFLHITKGDDQFVHQTRAEVEAMLSGIGFIDFESRRVDRWYPHPHILYTARKP